MGRASVATDLLAIDAAGLRRTGRERLGWVEGRVAAAPEPVPATALGA